MKTTKWILACALAVFMTAAAIRAQKAEPDSMSMQSAELDALVDLAEMDLLSDMLESLLREEENEGGKSNADFQMPESGLACMPGMNMDIYGGEFGMDGFGGFPIMAGFGGFPIMAGFGGMGCFCGF